MAAALAGDVRLIQLLLEKKADMTQVDRLGRSVAHWVVQGGHKEAVALIFGSGANINDRDKRQRTPLMVAAALMDGTTPARPTTSLWRWSTAAILRNKSKKSGAGI